MLLAEAAKLSLRDAPDRTLAESASLEALCPSDLESDRSGKAQGKPFVGAAAIGSGMPDTFRGLGLMTGARRGGLLVRMATWLLGGERGAFTPLLRGSVVMPRSRCKLDTSDARDAF